MIFLTGTRKRQGYKYAAVALAAGISATVMWSAPANAVANPCGEDGSYLGNGICEQIFATVGPADFTPNLGMTALQLLIVGGGGNGEQGGSGYGGGGGEVKLVDYDSESPIMIIVGDQGEGSSAQQGNTSTTSAAGGRGGDSGYGGVSGNGNLGSNQGWPQDFGSGAGAGASPENIYDGGAGVIVSSIATTPGSPFADDSNCYGGGGPIGVPHGTLGASSCGAGTVTVPDVTLVLSTAALANTGGGGAGIANDEVVAESDASGGSGVVIARWKVQIAVTATFSLGGHGTAIAAITGVQGSPVAQPADPTADGFTFTGWFTDAALTTKADFSAALAGDVTYYAGWSAVLAATGASIHPSAIPLAVSVLLLGLGLLAAARRRKPTAH